MNSVELSNEQKECFRKFGWTIESPNGRDERGKLVLKSSNFTRFISPQFRLYAEEAGYEETSFNSTVVARNLGNEYVFAASAREPSNPESHLWGSSGDGLVDLVQFVGNVINPVLFGIGRPAGNLRGNVSYAVVNVGQFMEGFKRKKR